MKKKSVSKIAKGRYAKVLVFRGSKEKTVGGLSASSLTKNKYGRVVSKIAKGRYAKVLVFRGSKEKTVGGMTASSLTKNKHGRVVSKKRSAKGKKSAWIAAVTKARKALGLKGFVAIKKGSDLYKKAKELYQ